MIRFAYRVLQEPQQGWVGPGVDLEAELNRLGAEGFELRQYLGDALILVRMEPDEPVTESAPSFGGARPFSAAAAAATETYDALCGCGCGEIVAVPAARFHEIIAREPEAEAWAPGHYEPGMGTCIAVPTPKHKRRK